jgi:hypothetical protein
VITLIGIEDRRDQIMADNARHQEIKSKNLPLVTNKLAL